MFVSQPFSSSAKLVAVAVSLVSFLVSLDSIRNAPFLSERGKEAMSSPLATFLLAFGTGYAVVGDAATTASSLLVLYMIAFYVLVLRPDIGSLYLEQGYLLKKPPAKKPKTDDGDGAEE